MNKGNQPSGDGQKLAEFVERRGLAEGNTRRAPTAETQGSGKVSRGLSGVREAAHRDKRSRGNRDATSRARYRKPGGGCVRFCRGIAVSTPLAQCAFSPSLPEARAVCGNAARTDLYGGCPVRGIPTVSHFYTPIDSTRAHNRVSVL